MWGQHLIVDMAGCDSTAVGDRTTIARFCRDLVAAIGMTAHGEPLIEHFAAHMPDVAGYSLVQLIETSSITGHFVEARNEAYLDVFSCRPFSDDAALAVCRRYFRPAAWSTTVLQRQAGQASLVENRTKT